MLSRVSVCFYCAQKPHRLKNLLTNNVNAKHLYESMGFQTEGCMRSTICLDGVYEDEYIMSMLKPEWHARYGV
jgi:hypothetical protein